MKVDRLYLSNERQEKVYDYVIKIFETLAEQVKEYEEKGLLDPNDEARAMHELVIGLTITILTTYKQTIEIASKLLKNGEQE